MRGVVCSPHVLQVVLLGFSGFFLLGSFTQFVYQSHVKCRYHENGHDDDGETNNEYLIECIGNSITAGCYGVTCVMIVSGAIFSLLWRRDADLLISFVIFGILTSYTSDVATNLRVNCTAGDTTDQNPFDDDSFQSSESKCQTLTFALVGGCLGIVGGFIGGLYGVLMKLNSGKFYIQRPIGLFVAMAGYAMVFSFNNLANSFPLCHWYSNGKARLPDSTPPYIEDDIVYGQLDPLCVGYTNTAVGYGVGALLAFIGIAVMLKFQKRGMWVILSLFCAICSSSNYSTFLAAKLSSCDSTDNKLSKMYNSYQENLYKDSCSYYGDAVIVSIIATCVSGIAAVIGGIDTLVHIDHDTLTIRIRRSLMFAFACCFSISNSFITLATMETDCDLYHGHLSDDSVSANIDDGVMRSQCEGKQTQVVFYCLAALSCAIGVLISLYYNFPDTHQAVGLMGIDDDIMVPQENDFNEASKLLLEEPHLSHT
jgi:hypothetical protein